MDNPWAALILAAFLFALATLIVMIAWHHYWPRAERRLQTMISEAIATPLPNRYRDWDAEMRRLILDEHNQEHPNG